LEQRINADVPGEVLCRSFGRLSRAVAADLHVILRVSIFGSSHSDSKQGLDRAALFHGPIGLDDSLELGLKIEDHSGIDAAFQDIFEQLASP